MTTTLLRMVVWSFLYLSAMVVLDRAGIGTASFALLMIMLGHLGVILFRVIRE